jgi:hypothetical protein
LIGQASCASRTVHQLAIPTAPLSVRNPRLSCI